MKKVLLHICCGVCAYACIKALQDKSFYVEGFFYNPNIHPQEEYLRRKEVTTRLSEITSVDITYSQYDLDKWQQRCQEYKDIPEGGARCIECYDMRLKKTLEECINKGFDYFTTTLTVSPHKNSMEIIELGKKNCFDKFLPIDFKKNDGFKKSIEAAKKYNFYCQKYCGCTYSI